MRGVNDRIKVDTHEYARYFNNAATPLPPKFTVLDTSGHAVDATEGCFNWYGRTQNPSVIAYMQHLEAKSKRLRGRIDTNQVTVENLQKQISNLNNRLRAIKEERDTVKKMPLNTAANLVLSEDQMQQYHVLYEYWYNFKDLDPIAYSARLKYEGLKRENKELKKDLRFFAEVFTSYALGKFLHFIFNSKKFLKWKD